jgi:hypothetical protein
VSFSHRRAILASAVGEIIWPKIHFKGFCNFFGPAVRRQPISG